jgi:hypothetical protein
MRKLVNGRVFVEFRNQLFSMFTFNRLTAELIKELCDPEWQETDLSFLRLDLPPERPYDKMLARFHNPFEVTKLFERNGFHDVKITYYHQHPAPPFVEKDAPEFFRIRAMQREGVESWKNMFTCSAFVVEASNE